MRRILEMAEKRCNDNNDWLLKRFAAMEERLP